MFLLSGFWRLGTCLDLACLLMVCLPRGATLVYFPALALVGIALPEQVSQACSTAKLRCEGRTWGTGALLPRLTLSPGNGVKGPGLSA